MQENKTVAEWKQEYQRICSLSNVSAHDYGGFAYDAVWTYAFALDKLMREDQTHLVKIHDPNTVK